MKNNGNNKRAVRFTIHAAILTVVVALITVITGQPRAGLAQSPRPGAVRGASLSRLGALVALRQPSTVDTSYLNKLDTQTQELVADFLSTSDAVGAGRAHNARVSPDGRVLIDIYVKGDLNAGAAVLRRAGMDIGATDTLFNRVSGYLPLTGVTGVAQLAEVKAVVTVRGFGSDEGSVTSQGDASHNGPAARALGYNGSGVKVGVISDSMDQVGGKVAGSQVGGDLPAGVTVLSDDTSGFTIDEGRAMAEIIYDTAPGITQMYFGSGTATGAAGKATAIDNLVNAGVSIIADDIYYLSEPFFQDGPVAQAVDRARDKGVLYFASAGNRARQSFEHTYITGTNGYYDFDTSPAVDFYQTVATVPAGAYIELFLQWDDPWGSATNDYDIELFDTSVTPVKLAFSYNDNVATGLPSEDVYWKNTTGNPVIVTAASQNGSARTLPHS